MPTSESLLLFLGATLALALTPGPDLLYIATRSASEGRAAGVVSVLGVSLGLVVHTFAIAFGLSAFLATVPIAYEVVRLVGTADLAYLGLTFLRRPPHLVRQPAASRSRLQSVLAQRVLTHFGRW